jgi:hypothetical protein
VTGIELDDLYASLEDDRHHSAGSSDGRTAGTSALLQWFCAVKAADRVGRGHRSSREANSMFGSGS